MTRPSGLLRRPLGLLFHATVLAVLAGACGSAEGPDLGPRPPCSTERGTCVAPVQGGSGSGSSGGGDGGALSNELRGLLGMLSDPSFMSIGPYGGAATIFAPSASGALAEAPYPPATGSSFTLTNLRPGQSWVFVRDETAGATGILSTHSLVRVPSAGDVMLPVLDRNVLMSIAGMLPVPATIEDGKAHLVLLFVRSGQPVSGVGLETALPGAVIAYDSGVGVYTNQASISGPAGIALVLNLDAPLTAEYRRLTLTEANGAASMIELPVQSNAATFAAFEL